MAQPVKVGIISIGEMGVGIAKLLAAHGYVVLTNITGRSDYTHRRAATAPITLLDSDTELVAQADYILSIGERATPLCYLDLNAISPGRAREIAQEFATNAPQVIFIDGGILGGPPKLLESNGDNSGEPGAGWKRPAIPLAGPPLPNAHLAQTLNSTYLGPKIGAASGLKCCFAAFLKGLIALSIQSFSTAEALGIYDELQGFLRHFQPALQETTSRMVTEIPPKAGRWVDEMLEIGRCFGEEGGWDNVTGTEGANIYQRVAELYRTISEDTVLGQERQEHRVRGNTAGDIALAVEESLNPNYKK
ncbi:6-phosphogluconate dehydrogenase C-terminal domain-like protein [Penicillium malachiteum]|nr:6-phosphogluconate dehydrogenase C-terminal domain-like protein [Penicillium malachiteum]